MKKNVGIMDRIVRFVPAFIIAVLRMAGIVSGTGGTILTIAAIVLLVTSLTGFCPLYLPFGINTNKSSNNK